MGAERPRIGAILAILLAACGPPARPGDVLTPAERPTPHLALHGPKRLHLGERGTFTVERNATACDAIDFEVGAPCGLSEKTGGTVTVVGAATGACAVEVRTDGACGVVRATVEVEVVDAAKLVPVTGDACGTDRRLDAGDGRWCGFHETTTLRVAPGVETLPIDGRLQALLDDGHVLTCNPDGCAARDFFGHEVATFAARWTPPDIDWVVLPGAPVRLLRAWNDSTVDGRWHVDDVTWDGAHFTVGTPSVFRSAEPADMRATPFGGAFLYLARRTDERPYGVVRALPSGDYVGRGDALLGLVNVGGVLVDATNGVAFRTNPLEDPLFTLPRAARAGVAVPGVPLVATAESGCTDLGEGDVLEVRDVSRPGFPLVAFGCFPAGSAVGRAMCATPGGVELPESGDEPAAFLRFSP